MLFSVNFKAKTLNIDSIVSNETSKTEFEWVGTIGGEATKIKAIGLEKTSKKVL